MEEDTDPQSAEFREASGVALEHLDLEIDSFGCRIGDPVTDVGEKAGQVFLEHARHLLHRLELGVDGAPEPALELRCNGFFGPLVV